MATMTLLEMTQNILSAMDSDEVNSIYDTIESQQVAETVKETFNDLFGDLNVPEHKSIIKLEGLGDLTKPNYLRIPTNVKMVDWVKYKDSITERWQTLTYLPPVQFLQMVLNWKSTTEDTALITDDSGVEFYVKNNKSPQYYTIFNDEHMVFDSYDISQDTTLQASKTLGWGEVEPEFEMEDDYVPDLDSTLFPFLLSEAKSVCFVNIKQVANQKEEQRARRHRIAFQHKKWKDFKQRKHEFSNEGADFARNR